MILVTGAAGKTGRAVLKALVDEGAAVRGLVRRPEQAEIVRSLGAAEIAIGSFDHPPALSHAMADAEAVYHICPNVSPHELGYACAVAAAARANGVKRFVYHSVLHPQIEAMPHHWQKLRAEEMLLEAGLDVTILQPAAYMQNILGGWRGIIEGGIFRVPFPIETRLSLVDLKDVAAVAALVLTKSGYGGASFELVGTLPLSQIEVAAAIRSTLGCDVRAEAETPETWEMRARSGGLGDYERETLVAMFRHYAAHGLAGNPQSLRWLLGRPPNGLAEFLAAVVSGRDASNSA
ncbi:MAG TPA: NmrA family NAD(P)-binding protein [Xanthobacteraceae bacterium]|nr:NmrA family NAD(P)-binding protein [Xanthobacteraceae bacterium]